MLSSFAYKGGNRVALFFMIFGSVCLPLILVATNGSIVVGVAFLVVLLVVLVTLYRLDWGFNLFIAAVLLSDNYNIPGFEPLTFKAGYLLTLNVLVPGLGVGALTPMEIHLLFLVLVWALHMALNKQIRPRPVSFGIPAILFFIWIGVATVYGIVTGGDKMKSIWEIRGSLYLGIVCFFVSQVITTRKQLTTLVWICIGSMAVKASQAADRFIELGFSMGTFRALAAHEDPIILVTLFILLVGFMSFGCHSGQKRALVWLLLPMTIGFYAANRRAGYIAFLFCILAFIVLLPPKIQSRAIKVAIVCAVLFAAYLRIYWNDYGRIAQFAQAVKSAVSTDYQDMRREDYLSGLARDQENYNLAMTLRRQPLGLGFGKQHDWIIMNYGEFSMKGYITHNQILWLLVKSGPIGFFLFLFFMNSVLFHGSMGFTKMRDPYLMAVLAMCILAIPNQIIATYVDMGFHRFRSMTYLGLLIGLIPVIKSFGESVPSAEAGMKNG